MTKPSRPASNGREAPGRVVVARGEGTGRAESRQPERGDAGVEPAGEHDVGGVPPYRLERLADGVVAGRARRDGRVVDALESVADRDVPGREVDDHPRHQERGDAAGTALREHDGLLLHELQAADPRADDHSRALRFRLVELPQSRVRHRLRRGDDSELLEAREAPRHPCCRGPARDRNRRSDRRYARGSPTCRRWLSCRSPSAPRPSRPTRRRTPTPTGHRTPRPVTATRLMPGPPRSRRGTRRRGAR